MKKYLTKSLFIFVVSFMSVGSLSSQNLDQVLINQHYPVDFLGLDFSEFKFIGSSGVSGYTMRDKFFGEWNYMFYSEKKKYNIGNFIKNKSLHNFNSFIVFQLFLLNSDFLSFNILFFNTY